jgi:hypothetical protein
MHEDVTLLHPEAREGEGGLSAALPQDLLAQVRGRIKLLALLVLSAFSFDVLMYLVKWIASGLGHPVPDLGEARRFQGINLAAVAASAALWWLARSRSVSTSRLHTLGLFYEVVICFAVSFLDYWQYFRAHGILSNLTWVPAIVILFPLIMPGPPRRMLAAAVAAGAMPLLALLALDRAGMISANAEGYFQAAVGSAFGVVFAYVGASVVYGLGRQVVIARQLGSYVLEERLGEGGMGQVWRARHSLLARPAAIKLIRPSRDGSPPLPATQEMRDRFEREAQATARLRSPHTVNLFDFGVTADGAFYYVMELLEGLDADRLIRRFGPVPPERAIHLLRQVCHSLSEAESCGLVHRDIKPANVFVCRYGEDLDFVKVLDFGLVKALRDAPSGESIVTGAAVIHGTPAFIAPEQAMGAPDIDARADIYATGCLAYWLLTGHPVFTADTPMGLLVHHMHTPPAPPSARTEQPLPAAMDEIVLSCLAKERDERPQSARELSRRLAEVEGAGAWTESRAKAWWESHRPA